MKNRLQRMLSKETERESSGDGKCSPYLKSFRNCFIYPSKNATEQSMKVCLLYGRYIIHGY
jgi:hypothetical protein